MGSVMSEGIAADAMISSPLARGLLRVAYLS